MSTVCKLDRRVRLDRYLRKEQRRAMQADLRTIGVIIANGQKIMRSPDWPRYTNASKFKHERLLKEMIVRQTIMKLTLKHITGIMLDPRRTGARKEEILAKLGATPEPAQPVIQTALRGESAGIPALRDGESASKPIEGIV